MVSGGCMFCEGLEEHEAQHSRKQCPLFRHLKGATTRSPYIAADLNECEKVGYASAGILPWRRTPNGDIELLLAREYRKPTNDTGGDLLNFLGGKRHKKETDPLSCAVDKVDTETGHQLSRATISHMRSGCPLVCWSSESKYVLYLFELVGNDDFEVDIRCAGLSSMGIKRLEWTSRDELLSSVWTRRNIHRYAVSMLEQLTSCQVMLHIEELFDLATRDTEEEHQDEETGDGVLGMTAKEASAHFNLVEAIRSTLHNIQENHPRSLPLTRQRPSFSHLRQAVQAIPSRDFKKLALRLHPDRLRRALGREPSTLEAGLSNSVMQILNNLADTDNGSSEQDVIEGLKKVEKQRQRLDSGRAEQPSPGKNATAEMEEMLKRLSFKPRPR